MENDVMMYDYQTLQVKDEEKGLLKDIYLSLGYELIEEKAISKNKTKLEFKRKRELEHLKELNRLENKMVNNVSKIQSLKKDTLQGCMIFAYIFGVISTLLLGGGMSLIMALNLETLGLVLGIVLGVLGILGCVVNYFIYQKRAQKREDIILKKKEEYLNTIEIDMKHASSLVK